MATATVPVKPKARRTARAKQPPAAVRDALVMAEQKGLLQGARTMTIRGRMPAQLVAEAKRMTGITSDSKLIEAALAKMAVADDYGAWLVSQSGTINPDLDLEF